MRRIVPITLAAVVLAAIFLFPLSAYTVDRTEFVYVTQFGRHIATYDGADDDQAGLHFRLPWPVQSVQRFDRRLQYFDLPASELLTRDAKRNTIDKTLSIDAYVCWRIADADAVDRFIRSVGGADGARSVLGQRLNSELGAAVGRMELDDLISTEAGRVDGKREQLRKELLEGGNSPLRRTALEKWGVEVVDVRLRRTNHPAAVRQAIYDRIISEREKKSSDYRSEGERLAADIKSAGDRKVSELRSQAEAEAVRLRGQADAAADRIRADAARQDPQFYSFLKKLEDYQRILGDNKSTLLLSAHRELFDALFNPPNINSAVPSTSSTLPRYKGEDK